MNKKILKWNFIFQYGWVLTNIFNSILLLPLYLKNIDASTLGVWLATGNILGWLTLVDPGVGEVLQQKIAEIRGKGQNEETGKLIGSGFMASSIIFIGSLLLGIVFYFFLGRLIDKDINSYAHLPMAIFITVISTGLTLVSFSVSGINQGLHNSAHVAITSLSANFLFLFVNLIFLFGGWGVMSIAVANLCRAIFINIFNVISMFRLMKREQFGVVYDWGHFRKFVKIFSFTSASKIITGISYSIDMIVLARYISPAAITMFEINKRPVNITYSLIGRHSVALQPLISHAKGSGDKEAILTLIRKQFRFYCYAALFASFLFIFNYENLVSAWTSKAQFAGQTIINLLIANFIVSLISYFISVVGYALGDIKMNSLYNIIRNIFYGFFMFFAARHYGIMGTVIVSIVVSLLADLTFYSIRLNKLGYFDAALWKNIFTNWLVIVPLCFLGGWGLSRLIGYYVPENMFFVRLILNSGSFTIFYFILILSIDSGLRQMAQQFMGTITSKFFFKKVTA